MNDKLLPCRTWQEICEWMLSVSHVDQHNKRVIETCDAEDAVMHAWNTRAQTTSTSNAGDDPRHVTIKAVHNGKEYKFYGDEAEAIVDSLGKSDNIAYRKFSKQLAAAEEDLAKARDVIAELVDALDRAHDDMAAWQGYASPYFLEKHGADDDLKAIKDTISKATAHLNGKNINKENQDG